MKTNLAAFLVLICLGAGILAAEGFSAAAKRRIETRHVSEDFYPRETVPVGRRLAKYAPEDSADCYDLSPDSDVPEAIEHHWVGSTHHDYQQNGSMGRMISVTSSGYRHFSWMYTDHPYPPGPRFVDANRKDPAGGFLGQVHADGGDINAGYSSQTHLHDGTSVIVHNRLLSGGPITWGSALTMDEGVSGDSFPRHWDIPDHITGAPSGEPGIWPKADVLYHETEERDYIHMVLTEHNSYGPHAVAYERCYLGAADTLICQCFESGAPRTYRIASNVDGPGALAPLGYFDYSGDVSSVVTVSPVSHRVAVAYGAPACDGTGEYHSDLCYVESMSNGEDWVDGTNWPPFVHNMTNFGCMGHERVKFDLSACYDYEDSLHIVYVTCGFNPDQPGYYQPGVARLYHWCKQNGISLIASKIQEGAHPGAHNVNIAKPSISAKDPIYHPGGDSIYLFCVWTQVDSSDQNAAGDQGNGDLFGCGSFDGGDTWATIYNLTGTQTPGCLAGDCLSEHWPSLAKNMYDGDLHIQYICDRDAGGAIMDEGAWTENPVMYMRLPEWEVWSCRPGIQGRIIEPPHWYHPPIKVLLNQSRTIVMRMYNLCNREVLYSVTSDHPCIQVNIPQTPLAPKDSVTVNIVLDGTGACEGTFISGNVIIWTELYGGTTQPVRVHAVVADDYYECPRDPETVDTLENDYLRMYVNVNCQQWIHDIGYVTDTTHEVFFRGGTIVATTSGGDTLVGRYMGDNDMCAGAQDKLYKEQCEPEWEPHFWIVYTKDVYIEATNLAPPAHQKWWWWEIAKQIKFFKPGAPEEYQRIVIKYVRVKRQDPPGWWPDQTHFAGYDDTYIGFAMDIDAPFDTSRGPEPNLGDENGLNYGRYDATYEIAYVTGFGRAGEHPEYNDYHAGIALAEGGTGSPITPYATANVKNNDYLYPQAPWGWEDGELYQLAAGLVGGTTFIQDPDSIVDRNVVLTASKIDAGTDPDQEAEFTLVEFLAPEGEAQMRALVDTARAIVAREREEAGLPAICGDCNGDLIVDVGDVVCLISYLFRDGSRPKCPAGRADCNSDDTIDIGDIVYLVGYLYRGGPTPVCPGIW